MTIRLKIGLSESDRTRPLATGEVPLHGIEAAISLLGVQALFNEQLTRHTFDVCEFPLGTYLRTLERDDKPYLAIPIFPSRHFRFSSVFVNTNSGVAKPADLADKKIGVAVFDMAAAVWLRGIFADFHALPRTAPRYVTAGFEGPRAGEEHPQFHPEKFRIETRHDKGLAQMLADGEIDALYTARAPSSFGARQVACLFADTKAEAQNYFKRTGIFPAMHVLAVKRPLAAQHPELVPALFNAFSAAQKIARAKLFEAAALATMLPWQLESLQEAERLMGPDYWPAGLEPNRSMLETIIRYMREDGLISTPFTPEDLFSPAMLEG